MVRSLIVCLIALCCTVVWSAPGSSVSVVSGWVRVASENDKGDILTVEIVVGEGEQEDPYLVLPGAPGDQLRDLLGEYVVASGTVTEDPLGWKTIQVTRFTKVDDLPQPEPEPGETPTPQPTPPQ